MIIHVAWCLKHSKCSKIIIIATTVRTAPHTLYGKSADICLLHQTMGL